MTKSTGEGERGESRGPADPDAARCRWCRRTLPVRTGPGRPRQFCSQRCRQWDWVARQRAAELQINERELVIARDELERVHDELYVLACAVDDVERDLSEGGRPTLHSLQEALDWLLDAARPLRDLEIAAAPAAPAAASSDPPAGRPDRAQRP